MMRARALAWILCLLVAPAMAGAAGSQWEWEGVSRIVALGDVHGSYDKMVTLLQGTKMVDDQLAWIGGNQHLVFCGDLTDRGDNDRAVMDLVRRLQAEAEAAGGRVHMVLGNHEVMNLSRDRRYWNQDLLDEFAKDETKAERRQAFKAFQFSASTQTAQDKRAFEEMFPPGYFARARAFESDGEYGSWLLEQPTVVKINGVLFLHGGLTQRVAALGLDEINRQVPADIRKFLAGAGEMGNVVPWPADFGSIMRVAYELAERRGRSPEVAGAKAVLEAHKGLAFEAGGPVWYRGTSVENERLERDRVHEVLKLLDARAEMVGHTVTRTGRISSRFNGTVYRADVGMGYGRPPLAAVLEGEGLLVFNPATATLTAALVEPLQGEGWPAGEEDLSDHQLERFLEKAEIKSRLSFEVEGVHLQVLELEQKDMKLRALFGDAQETAEQAAAEGRQSRRMYQHQVAAYKLDRQFGLDMVPVTVLRKVDGKKGGVQIWIQGALDLTGIQEYGGEAMLDDLGPEIARARAFSALIGLQDRLDFGKLVLPIPRRVMIADNGVSFSENPNSEDLLEEGCGPVGAAFLRSLGTLEAGKLKKALGGLLSAAQLDAILKRRDGILEMCVTPDPDWSIRKILDRQ